MTSPSRPESLVKRIVLNPGAQPTVSLSDIAKAFITVFPAELPDKTMIATVVLVARYRRPLYVWLGAISAFAIHVTVAVAAGSLLALLPDRVVSIMVAIMFAAGAVVLFRSARSADDEPDAVDVEPTATPWATVVGSFALVALAEWGDLTQLATAGLAARSGEPVATAIGAFLALASVAAIAATVGQQLVARIPLHRINYLAAGVFAALAAWTVYDIVA